MLSARSDVSTGNSLSGPQLYNTSIVSVISAPVFILAVCRKKDDDDDE